MLHPVPATAEVDGFVERALYVDGQVVRMAVICGSEAQVATPVSGEGRQCTLH